MNIYYDPQSFGLEILDSIEEENMSYEFNMLVVWKDLKDQTLYYDQDSGCSCPSPFEGIYNKEEMTRLTKENFDGFEKTVNAFPANLSDRIGFLSKVSSELFNTKS